MKKIAVLLLVASSWMLMAPSIFNKPQKAVVPKQQVVNTAPKPQIVNNKPLTNTAPQQPARSVGSR